MAGGQGHRIQCVTGSRAPADHAGSDPPVRYLAGFGLTPAILVVTNLAAGRSLNPLR